MPMAISLSTFVESVRPSQKPIIAWIYRDPSEGLYHWGLDRGERTLTSGLMLYHPVELGNSTAPVELAGVGVEAGCRSRGGLRIEPAP